MSTPAAAGAVQVTSSPRSIGTRCGVKSTARPSSCSISAVCRWVEQPVGVGVVGEGGELQPLARRRARARRAAQGADADLPLPHEPRVAERPEREHGRGRVAPRHRHGAGPLELVAVALDEAVDRGAQELGRGVGVPVPPRPRGLVVEAKVRAEVHDDRPGGSQRAHERRRTAVRQGHEDDLAALEGRRGARRVRDPRVGRGQRRRVVADERALVALRGDDGDLEDPVRRQRAQELGAHVPGRADDPHAHPAFYAQRCIEMQARSDRPTGQAG